jgi:hypothetical protein
MEGAQMNKPTEYLHARITELETRIKAQQAAVNDAAQASGKEALSGAIGTVLRAVDKSIAALAPDPEGWNGDVKYDGEMYYTTGKWGNRISDGMMGREYRSLDDARIWVYRDGTIAKD